MKHLGSAMRDNCRIDWTIGAPTVISTIPAFAGNDTPVASLRWRDGREAEMSKPLRVLGVGSGGVGLSHARAFDDLDGLALVAAL
jgi:hypothetical protein